MPVTRAPIPDDYSRILTWVPDAPALYLFAGPSLQWPPTVAQFEAIARRPGLSAWVASDDDDPDAWGHFDLTLLGASARLGRVIVDPRYRGRGRGHTLIRLAVQKARELGADTVNLAVVTDNAPAVSTYRRAEFEEVVDPERPEFTSMSYRVRPQTTPTSWASDELGTSG
ncbi:GNAT family N-acetyltransferase [Agreia sp. COWG]|uniref:GNAT family N-acetyltransferase n=1 Tax=Agreia sp. COWG TaxID=2773266 RepID=UPI001925DE3F|nr:GNAT family N-acetyltransferase [Agreia sp. COWG]CAD6010583.1 GNAT family N-acetyltransferase [Agreia sp. COWG]